jgi:ribonuclease E
MVKRMLIDATHPEETRVVVMSGTRLEEFKVTRVEPSLQAAFVDYGGNRHGFLPFSEIHPDYYKIPIADREALLAEEEALSADDESDSEDGNGAASASAKSSKFSAQSVDGNGGDEDEAQPGGADVQTANGEGAAEDLDQDVPVDTVGGDEAEEDARRRARLMRHYKIQEVIKRRQVILVQVSKEERGTKGAALTTYLSLAGRYCVLMPNTARGGGISRKNVNAADRRRLKKVLSELEIPQGMAVIVRTAGSERTKAEIRRDYDYLLRLWSEIRDTTLNSTAPSLVHEEGNLIKRAIRDLYSRDMEDIQVEGEESHSLAKAFMRSLIPSHAKKVQLYDDSTVPLFNRHQVESQLDAMYSSTVRLKSGGYIVINPTEALVAIDVNSGKSTKERHIEETALKTNLEASEEVARQLRLRDLAGLIVIDYIDMEESRHNRDVERKLKDAMRHDRARIQLGRISPFGLLELSRQRLRPSLQESSSQVCGYCQGSGHVRSTDSTALHVLRALEEEGIRRPGGELVLAVPPLVARYILNQMRQRLVEIEQRYRYSVQVESDDSLRPPDYALRRVSDGSVAQPRGEARAEATADDEDGRKVRRRRRRRRPEDSPAEDRVAAEAVEANGEADTMEAPSEASAPPPGEDGEEDRQKRRRRRGKRAGRRRGRRRDEDGTASPETGATGAPDDTSLETSGPESAAPTEAADDGAPTVDPGQAPLWESPVAAESASSEVVPDTQSPVEDVNPEAAAGEAEEKPKRRRQPRRKAGSATRVEAAPSEGTDEQTPAAPKPRRRRRPAKARDAAATAVPEAAPEPAPAGEPATPPDAPDDAPVDYVASARTEAQPPLAADSADGPAFGDIPPNGEDDDGKPRRKGWWQRWI